jgi:hypothetical protein
LPGAPFRDMGVIGETSGFNARAFVPIPENESPRALLIGLHSYYSLKSKGSAKRLNSRKPVEIARDCEISDGSIC